MSQTHEEIRALRVMVEELRAEPPPELPWDAMEQRLLSRLAAPAFGLEGGSGQHAEPPVGVFGDGLQRAGRSVVPGYGQRRSPTLMRLGGLAAVAAAVALGVGSLAGTGERQADSGPPRHQVDAAAVAFAPGSTRVHDLAALRSGDVVASGDAPLRFGRAGLATWVLAPGSVAHVDSMGHDGGSHTPGVGHTITLERGAIRAEVTPRDPAEGLVEAFAVEVGGTRVAVHGTAFSVKIEGSLAIVDVEHGAVAVGPVGHVGATTGHLLVGPSRASFSLDGGRSARLLDRASGPIVASDVEEVAGEPSAAGIAVAAQSPLTFPAPVAAADAVIGEPEVRGDRPAAAPAPKPALAARAPIDNKAAAHPVLAPPTAPEASEPSRLTVATVQGRLMRCFRLTYEANPSPDSGFSVSSVLRVDVRADGTWAARFDPALHPKVQHCAGGAMSGRFPDNAGHIDIPVSFQP